MKRRVHQSIRLRHDGLATRAQIASANGAKNANVQRTIAGRSQSVDVSGWIVTMKSKMSAAHSTALAIARIVPNKSLALSPGFSAVTGCGASTVQSDDIMTIRSVHRLAPRSFSWIHAAPLDCIWPVLEPEGVPVVKTCGLG